MKNKSLADSGRIFLYDNVKLVAILMVVVGHAIDFLARKNGNYLEKSLFTAIYSVHMPLFIFISGLFMKPMDKNTQFPKQKVLSFVLIGMTIRVFSSLLRLAIGNKPSFAVFDMYDSYAWFVGAMAVFIAVVWMFREYNSKIFLLITIVIGCMAGYDKNLGDKLALMRIFVFLPVFVAGYVISSEKLIMFFKKKRLKVLSAVFIVFFLCLCVFSRHFTTSFRGLFTGRNTYDILGDYYKFGFAMRALCYAISGMFGFSIMCLVPDKSFGWLTRVGTKTLQIYFWHKLFLIVFEKIGVYGKIESVTGSTAATFIYILIAVGLALLCSLKIFSFPTNQLLRFGKKS